MSKSNKLQIIIIVVLALIVGVLVYFLVNANQTNNMSEAPSQNQENSEKSGSGHNGNNQMGKVPGSSSESVETTGATTITSEESESGKTYESTASDESAIIVTDGGNFTMENATVSKTGDTSNTENSEFYGVNAGILAKTDATINISNAKITTNSKGSNAVFATGENAKIYISDSTIETSSSSSRGLDSTYGGYIEADNVTISTQGGSCATLATDRGEGTVIAKNSNLKTAGAGSPIIYSTGDITAEKVSGTATGAQMVVVEGKNKATVTDSTLICSGKGNRNDVDNCGIMIYQSMSGDAGEGTGTFSATNSKLTIDSSSNYNKTAPFFFITNTQAVINLENNTLEFGSGILLSAKGTSEWGKSGSNGGDAVVNATNQELSGDIEIDNISTLELNLKEGSSYKGTINAENSAKSISISIDKTSTISLTGDTYVTSLDDEDTSYSNINFNGYSLYVNGIAIQK